MNTENAKEVLKLSDYMKTVASNISDGADENDYYDLLLAQELVNKTESTEDIKSLISSLESKLNINSLQAFNPKHKRKVDSVKYEFIPYRNSVIAADGKTQQSSLLKAVLATRKLWTTGVTVGILYGLTYVAKFLTGSLSSHIIENTTKSVTDVQINPNPEIFQHLTNYISFITGLLASLLLISAMLICCLYWIALWMPEIGKILADNKLIEPEWFEEAMKEKDSYADANDTSRIETCKNYIKNLESFYNKKYDNINDIRDYVKCEVEYRDKFMEDEKFKQYCLGKL